MRRALLPLLVAVLMPATAPAAPPPVVWDPCPPAAFGAQCGHVAVPLDRLDAGQGTIPVGFELYRHRDASGPAAGTLLDEQGGPGYPTTESRASYLELHGPLLEHRDLLLVDARGTGTSQPLTCRAFSRYVTHYRLRAGECAAEIGPTVDLYDTHAVVDDLASVLDALGIRVVDLYGDSYGSYVGQAFAVRYPERLRSLVLDGTYPLPGTDPAFGDLAEATQRGFRLVCARRPSCALRGEDPVAAVGRLAELLRARPTQGTGVNGNGRRRHVTVDVRALATSVQDAYANLSVYRDLLAAGRAYEIGDRVPLLRLLAENAVGRFSGSQTAPEALYLAVVCHDYPQMWDPAASVPERQAQLAALRASLPPERFAPFTPTEWTQLRYEGAAACLRWPGPARPDPAAPPDAPYPVVPTLVLNGDLDTITASSGARVVASRFAGSTFVELQNTIHVSALGDRDGCGAPIARRFVLLLSAGDTSCAARVAEVRVVDRFPRLAAEADAALSGAGDASTEAERRVAAVAAATLADAIQRWAINSTGHDLGLRGGSWSSTGTQVVRFRLDHARFAADVAVSGTATWDTTRGPVEGSLVVEGPAGVRERLEIAWTMQGPLAQASLAGWAGDHLLHATMLAP